MSDGYENFLQRYFAFAVAKSKTAWGLPMPDYWEAINQAVSRVDISELRRVTVVHIFVQSFTSKMEVNAHELTAEEAITGLQAWIPGKKEDPPLVSTYMVICAGDQPIIQGPGPDDIELLMAAGAAEGYNWTLDRPVVIQWEGTPLQLAALNQLKRYSWLDDPANYLEDVPPDETGENPEIVFEDMIPPTQIRPATELIPPETAPEQPPPTTRKKRGGQLSMLP